MYSDELNSFEKETVKPVPENTNNESIERLVTERLESLFGDDEEEQAPPPSTETAPPFKGLQDAVNLLKSEMTPEALGRLDDEIRDIGMIRGEDPLFRPLLKMIGLLREYLNAPGKDLHEKTMGALFSLLECMEDMVQEDALTDIQRRRRVQKEIESFKAFRSSVQAVPKAAPAPPAEESVAQAAPPDDLRKWLQDALQGLEERMDNGFRTMASRMNEIQAALKERPDPQETGTLSRIEGQLGMLASLPQTLNGLRTSMLKAFAALNETLKKQGQQPLDGEALAESLKAAVREEVGPFKAALKAEPRDTEARSERDRASAEALSRLEDHMKRVQGETASLREEIHALHTLLSDLQASLDRSKAREERQRRGAARNHEDLEKGALPADENPTEMPLMEPLSRKEDETAEEFRNEGPPLEESGALHSQEPHLPEPGAEGSFASADHDENLPTGSYFLFETGEKKYAVDARHVVKAVGIGSSLLKKARNRGGLTISDATPGLFNAKKGLEPAWASLSSAELRQTLYVVVSDDSLDGLAQTTGGGALFLAVNDKRHLILTNQAAEKALLGQEDEVQMAGTTSESGADATCGSILRSGEGGAFYLIVSPEKLD